MRWMKAMKIKARQKARGLALQALYQWQFKLATIDEINQQAITTNSARTIDFPYFTELALGVVANLDKIDSEIVGFINRPLQEVDLIEMIILRIATYELLFRLEIPYKVVINEALELAKTYGSVEQGYKFINGVLDKLAKKIRIN